MKMDKENLRAWGKVFEAYFALDLGFRLVCHLCIITVVLVAWACSGGTCSKIVHRNGGCSPANAQ